MKNIFGRLILPLTVAATLIGNVGSTVMAADSETIAEPSVAYSDSDATPYAQFGISDVDTRIYTGNGSDRWLHITPWVTPNTLTIKMVDYSGGVVWKETCPTTGTSHWFVGSNVQYVYLSGFPGGVVDVTNSAN